MSEGESAAGEPPMTIRFVCPECQELVGVSDAFAGLHARCPNCSVTVAVPASSSTAAPKRAEHRPLLVPVSPDPPPPAPPPPKPAATLPIPGSPVPEKPRDPRPGWLARLRTWFRRKTVHPAEPAAVISPGPAAPPVAKAASPWLWRLGRPGLR